MSITPSPQGEKMGYLKLFYANISQVISTMIPRIRYALPTQKVYFSILRVPPAAPLTPPTDRINGIY